jgi:hypothetical protein
VRQEATVLWLKKQELEGKNQEVPNELLTRLKELAELGQKLKHQT